MNFPFPFFKSLFYSAKCLNLITSNLDSLWESKKWFRDNLSSIKRKCLFLYEVKNVSYAPSGYWNADTVYPDNYIFIVHQQIGKLVQTQREENMFRQLLGKATFRFKKEYYQRHFDMETTNCINGTFFADIPKQIFSLTSYYLTRFCWCSSFSAASCDLTLCCLDAITILAVPSACLSFYKTKVCYVN